MSKAILKTNPRKDHHARGLAKTVSFSEEVTPEGACLQHQRARIYLLLGEPEKALDQLEPLLKIPYSLARLAQDRPDFRSAPG